MASTIALFLAAVPDMGVQVDPAAHQTIGPVAIEGLSLATKIGFSVTLSMLVGSGIVRWYSEGWDSDKGRRFLIGSLVLVVLAGGGLFGFDYALKHDAIPVSWRSESSIIGIAALVACVLASIVLSVKSLRRRSAKSALPPPSPSPPLRPTTIAQREVSIAAKKAHAIITNDPGFLHDWVLAAHIYVIPGDGPLLTVADHKCEMVAMTERGALGFAELNLLNKDGSSSDGRIDKAKELILVGITHSTNIRWTDPPAPKEATGSLTIRDATEEYCVTIPIHFIHNKEWEWFAFPESKQWLFGEPKQEMPII